LIVAWKSRNGSKVKIIDGKNLKVKNRRVDEER
jgi:hypothetical protein